MNTTETLNSEWKDAITNLVIDDQIPNPRLTVPAQSLTVVREGLEQTLVMPETMQAYLTLLNSLNVRHPFRHDELLEETRREEVLESGLDGLSPHELAILALNPLQLLDVRDGLIDDDLSDYWLSVAERHDPDLVRLSELFDDYRQELASQAESARAPELAAAYFGQVDDSPASTVETKETGETWDVTVSLDDTAAVRWLRVDDEKFKSELSSDELIIDFEWHPTAESPYLDMRLNAPLLLTSSVNCSAMLLDAQGNVLINSKQQPIAGKRDGQMMQFAITADDLDRATQVQLSIDRPGNYHLQLQVSTSRPAVQKVETEGMIATEPAGSPAATSVPYSLVSLALGSPREPKQPAEITSLEFEIQAKDCHWIPAAPSDLEMATARVRLNVLPTGVLQVACEGFLRVKKGRTLEVIWVGADGIERARGTNPNQFSSVVELRGVEGSRPHQADRLNIRFSSASTPVEMGWAVEVTVLL